MGRSGRNAWCVGISLPSFAHRSSSSCTKTKTAGDLIDPIRPAVLAAKGRPGDKLENVIRANVEMGVARFKGLDPILSKLAKTGELKVVGGSYELRTGAVDLFG